MKQEFLKTVLMLLTIMVIAHQNLLATTEIDKALDVGAIDGTHAVNLSGAFTYTIPIKIPEGTRGMQPNLSLNYNSQSGNGNAGYGWNLSGASAISRVNKTIYHDGKTEAIKLNIDDALTLDGNRLIQKGLFRNEDGSYGKEFRTEMESFQEIRDTDQRLKSFTVKTKDGKTIEYGHTADSKLMAQDGLTALTWYINKVTDRNGNFMTYHYEKKGTGKRQVVLSKIEYTGNGITKPNTKVEFTYADRFDKSNAYIAGSKIENEVILDEIEVTTNFTQHYKSYKLIYTENHFSYLSEFQEWGIQIKAVMTAAEKTQRLNSLTFEYDGNEDFSAKNYFLSQAKFSDLADRNILILPGNFNGDGLQDFLTIKYERDGRKGKYTDINLMENNNKNGLTGFTKMTLKDKIIANSGNRSFMRYLNPPLDTDRKFDEKSLQPVEGIRILTGDINGDNIDDVIIYDHNILTYRYFESTGVGKYKFVSNKSFKVDEEHNSTLADVDGDGLLELFILDRSNEKNNIYLKSFDSRYNLHCSNFRNSAKFFANSTKMLPKDIDADGKMEIELLEERSIGTIRHLISFSSLLRVNENPNLCDLVKPATFNFTENIATTWGDIRNNPFRYSNSIADFNGDGRADNIHLKEKSELVEITINGNTITHNIPYLAEPNNKLYSNDLNSDGLTDCFYVQNGSPDKIIFYINNGDGSSFEEFTHEIPNLVDDASINLFQFADFDGDGTTEIFTCASELHYLLELNFKKPESRLLKTVYDSFANKLSVSYKALSSEENYLFNTKLNYPLRTISAPLQTVSIVTFPVNTAGLVSTKEYTYSNLNLHMQGKGLLGFSEVTETDNLNKIKTVSTFELDKTNILLKPTKTATWQTTTSPHTPLTESKNTFTIVNLTTPNRKWMRLDNTESIDFTNQTRTVKTFSSYDKSNGNILSSNTEIYEFKNNRSTLKYTSEEEATYVDCDWWITYLPDSSKTTLNRIGYPGIDSIKVVYEYNVANGNLTKETTDPTTSNQLATVYSLHDKFGNPKKTVVTATGETARSTSVVFDNTGRFITQRRNSKNNIVETTTINQIWGAPQSVTDIDGNEVKFTYDNYGRRSTSTDYTDHIGTTFYNWVTDTNAPDTGHNISSIFKVTSNAPNTPKTVGYFDKFNREVLTSTENFGSDTLYNFIKFDNRGRKVQQSGSFEIGDDKEKPTITIFTYDDLNRISTSVVQHNNVDITNTISYNYPVRTVEVSGTGIINKTTTMDVTGKVMTVQEYITEEEVGYLHYSYNNFNELSQVKDKEGKILTNSEYDAFGRQTALTDINAGKTLYTYNPFGELTSQTDAKKSVTAIVYDNLGRITSKTLTDVAGAVITYGYLYNSATANGALQLQSETGPNGNSTTYTYDANGRLKDKTDNISGQNFKTSQTYDAYGNVASVTYPQNFTVSYAYATTGALHKATTGTTTLYELTATNHLGQITDYTYNNGTIPVQHTFNELGMPATTKVKNGTLFNWVYNFNKTNGNLTSRQDVKNSRYENFKYDALHRLTHVNNKQLVFYNKNGNITNKDDAGDYTYPHTGKINAVTGISNSKSAIPVLTEKIDYTAFDRPGKITEGEKTYELFYGAQHNRKKTVYTDENDNKTTRFYSGNYEQLSEGLSGKQTHIYYLSFANSVDVIYVNETDGDSPGATNSNGREPTAQIYYAFTDYLGSILKVTDANGNTKEEQSFDAWGRKRNPQNWATVYSAPAQAQPKTLAWLNRGYTGHEHLYQFGLINMNNRLYDPIVGRMLAVDNFVVDSESTQAFNRYSYAMNNPLKFVDPSGELAFLPILTGMLVGAAIGAGTSAAIYTVNVAVTGAQWNWGAFGLSVAMGAVGGAIGGGLGSVGAQLGTFGQSLGYNILSNVASNSATTLAFGGEVTAGGLAGMVAGGVLGHGIVNFSGVKGGALKNMGAEIAFKSGKGAVTGGVGGAIGAAIDGNNVGQGFVQGAKNGAIAGATMAGLNILTMGPTYLPNKQYGNFGRYKPTYRRGHFLWPKGAGISLGRNLVTRLTGNTTYDEFLRAHETGHYYQQSKLGFGNFYLRTLKEYSKYGLSHTYETDGTLEWGANIYSLNKIGYFKSHQYQTSINNYNLNNYYNGFSRKIY